MDFLELPSEMLTLPWQQGKEQRDPMEWTCWGACIRGVQKLNGRSHPCKCHQEPTGEMDTATLSTTMASCRTELKAVEVFMDPNSLINKGIISHLYTYPADSGQRTTLGYHSQGAMTFFF